MKSPLPFLLLLTISLASCQEHKRLGLETLRAKDEIKAAQAKLDELESAYRSASQGINALKNDPTIRKGASHFELQTRNLDTSVGALNLKKAELETELEILKKDLAKYQSANL